MGCPLFDRIGRGGDGKTNKQQKWPNWMPSKFTQPIARQCSVVEIKLHIRLHFGVKMKCWNGKNETNFSLFSQWITLVLVDFPSVRAIKNKSHWIFIRKKVNGNRYSCLSSLGPNAMVPQKMIVVSCQLAFCLRTIDFPSSSSSSACLLWPAAIRMEQTNEHKECRRQGQTLMSSTGRELGQVNVIYQLTKPGHPSTHTDNAIQFVPETVQHATLSVRHCHPHHHSL